MGKHYIVALIAAPLAGIYAIGNGMEWANTAHDFYANYVSNTTPNQFQQEFAAWAFWFFFIQQIVIIGSLSMPVIAFVVIVAGVAAYFKSRR